jgi:hypothetical protein
MPSVPSQAEIIRRALESRISDVWTCLPGRVESYDSATQTADVLPTVRRPVPQADEEEPPIHEDLPVLPNVPVLFPRGGGYAITWPLQPGDHVLLVIATLSPQAWRTSGQPSDPGDLRLHHLGSAMAIPCLAPATTPLAQASQPALIVEGTEIRLGLGAVEYVALAAKVLTELQKIQITLSTALDGSSLPVTYGTPYVPAAVAAAKVKAE